MELTDIALILRGLGVGLIEAGNYIYNRTSQPLPNEPDPDEPTPEEPIFQLVIDRTSKETKLFDWSTKKNGKAYLNDKSVQVKHGDQLVVMEFTQEPEVGLDLTELWFVEMSTGEHASKRGFIKKSRARLEAASG